MKETGPGADRLEVWRTGRGETYHTSQYLPVSVKTFLMLEKDVTGNIRSYTCVSLSGA